MAFLWPTKSLVVLHVERSMIWAVGPPPFIAWADTSMLPSGDHPGKRRYLYIHIKLFLWLSQKFLLV